MQSGARQGYGRAWSGVYVTVSHKVVYEILVGPVPDKLTLDHLIESGVCTSTLCCNPVHLEVVTRGENLRRSPSTLAGLHSRKTNCPKGHPYSGDNLRIGKQSDGSDRKARFCRKCHAEAEARRRKRLEENAA